MSSFTSKSNLRYAEQDEPVSNCLCAFCCIENGRDNPAETKIGSHLSYINYSTFRYQKYDIPCCKNHYDFYDDQERYLHGIEVQWVYDLYERIHAILIKNKIK